MELDCLEFKPSMLSKLSNFKSERLMDGVGHIERNLGLNAQIKFLSIQPGEVKESFVDIEHPIQKLGYQPIINIDVGIHNFIEWYKDYHNVR